MMSLTAMLSTTRKLRMISSWMTTAMTLTSTMSVLQTMWMLDEVQPTSHVERLLAYRCTRPQCLRLQPTAHQQQGQRKEGSWKRAWRKEQCEVLQAANEASRSQRSSTSCTSMSSMRVNKPYDSAMHPRIQANSKGYSNWSPQATSH